MENYKIKEALDRNNGNISASARELGIPRTTLSDIVNRDREAFFTSADNNSSAVTYKDEAMYENGLATVDEAREELNLGEEYYAETVSLSSSKLKDGVKFLSSIKFVADRPLKHEVFLNELAEAAREETVFKPGRRPKPAKETGTRSGVIKADHHVGVGLDWDLHETSLEFMRDLKVQDLFDLGDLMSLDAFGRFKKTDPRWGEGFNSELKSSKTVLADNASVLPQDGRKEIIWGNHEARYVIYLLNDTPGLHKVDDFKLENLLRLEKFGYKLIASEDGANYPYSEIQIAPGLKGVQPGLVGIHGNICKKGSGNSVRAQIEKIGQCVAMGHVHDEAAVSVFQHRQLLMGFEIPSMAKLNLGYAKDPDHAQGFSYVTQFEDGTWNLEPVRWNYKTKTLTFRDQQWRSKK